MLSAVRSARRWHGLVRSFSTTIGGDSNIVHLCVVGSGPAGFYTVDKVLKKLGNRVRVTILDRLPTPFGLVRSGVAPDHQDTKNVTHQFSHVAQDARVSFFGNVTVGRDVSVAQLRRLYNAVGQAVQWVVLAYGAESDRRLGIPGEDAKGVFSAREFVWWYNGHPDARHLPVDLSRVRSVAVCGVGNVALDCARVLLQPPARLQPTDIARHALDVLTRDSGGSSSSGGGGGSKVERVHFVARRGPVQAACTPKELKELLGLPGVVTHAEPDQMVLSAQDEAEMKAQRIKRRVVELISKAAAASSSSSSSSSSGQVSLSYTSSSISSTSTSPAASASALARGVESSATAAAAAEVATESTSLKKHLHFQFYRSPVEVLTDGSGAACGMRVERTKLAMPADGSAPRAVGTGEFEELEAQLVLKSIGYRSLPLEGVPFDASRGVVPNSGGRVVSSSSGGGDVGHGLYVCGWLKRGPTGIIGTNLVDAEETVECLAADASSPGRLPRVEQQPAGSEGLARLLDAQRVRHVTWAQWLNVDEAEVGSGRQQGRVRDKLVDVSAMLAAAFSAARPVVEPLADGPSGR